MQIDKPMRPAHKISLIIPVCNEMLGLEQFLPALIERYPEFEIIVVDDGSTDGSGAYASRCGAKVIMHPYTIGNGASIKSGARVATGDILIFMDGDGQHPIEAIDTLLETYYQGYDMVVGARTKRGQASFVRQIGNALYNKLASWLVRQKVQDLTSGFRVVNARKFKSFLHLLPNGFSYPSTITLAFFRSGFTIKYIHVAVKQRLGKSHLKPFSDGIRFFIIIYKIAVLYSPLKIFLPFSLLYFILGLGHYGYTYFTAGRFTNMSLLCFTLALVIFLIGLVSEQITTLLYQNNYENQNT